MKQILGLLALCFGVVPFALGQQPPEAVNEAVAKIMPGVAPSWVKDAAVPGLYEVAFGPHVFYVSQDGRYLMRGDILEIDTRANITKPARNRARREAIDGVGEQNMIVFEPKSAEHTVTVFTDVDCAYCAKFHREMDDYLKQGIRVRYLAFPRAGIGSNSYDKIVSVWCNDDPHKAMGTAKAGRPVPAAECDNPVANHYELGRLVGVRGTPTIVLETGDVVPGYMPAGQLRDTLLKSKAEERG